MRSWLALFVLSILASCGSAEEKSANIAKNTVSKTSDPEAQSIEQAADEAAKLVEEESLDEIRQVGGNVTADN
jgi:basic membrane lipoprotein Med (substrate-binding protein (PBP1-ABC) superfamily)